MGWAAHYRRHDLRDSNWRYRRSPIWRPAATCMQACGLLVWAWLIHPHCDWVLGAGFGANALHLTLRLGCATLRCVRRGCGPVAQWLSQLEEFSETSEVCSENLGPDGDNDVKCARMVDEPEPSLQQEPVVEAEGRQ